MEISLGSRETFMLKSNREMLASGPAGGPGWAGARNELVKLGYSTSAVGVEAVADWPFPRFLGASALLLLLLPRSTSQSAQVWAVTNSQQKPFFSGVKAPWRPEERAGRAGAMKGRSALCDKCPAGL